MRSTSIAAAFLLIAALAVSPAVAQTDSVARYVAGLSQPDAEGQRDAAKALGAMGAEAGEAIGPLFDALESGGLDVKVEAAKAIRQIGAADREALINGLIERPEVMQWLNETRKDAGPVLQRALNALMNGGVTALADGLSGLTDKDSKLQAIKAIGAADLGASAAAGALIGELGSDDADIRRMAVEALGDVGKNQNENVDALKGMLDDPDDGVAEAAEEALNQVMKRKTPRNRRRG